MDAFLNVLKHFGLSVVAVLGTALATYFLDANALTKLFTDLGVAAPIIGIVIPALHALAVAIQNYVVQPDRYPAQK